MTDIEQVRTALGEGGREGGHQMLFRYQKNLYKPCFFLFYSMIITILLAAVNVKSHSNERNRYLFLLSVFEM